MDGAGEVENPFARIVSAQLTLRGVTLLERQWIAKPACVCVCFESVFFLSCNGPMQWGMPHAKLALNSRVRWFG